MRSYLKKSLFIILFSSYITVNAQDTFILNYEDVDIKKVTQDIAQFSKNNYFRSKSKR